MSLKIQHSAFSKNHFKNLSTPEILPIAKKVTLSLLRNNLFCTLTLGVLSFSVYTFESTKNRKTKAQNIAIATLGATLFYFLAKVDWVNMILFLRPFFSTSGFVLQGILIIGILIYCIRKLFFSKPKKEDFTLSHNIKISPHMRSKNPPKTPSRFLGQKTNTTTPKDSRRVQALDLAESSAVPSSPEPATLLTDSPSRTPLRKTLQHPRTPQIVFTPSSPDPSSSSTGQPTPSTPLLFRALDGTETPIDATGAWMNKIDYHKINVDHLSTALEDLSALIQKANKDTGDEGVNAFDLIKKIT